MVNSQSLFWAVGVHTNITRALGTAMGKIDETAIAQGRLITQISHTTTVLAGDDPALAAALTALGSTERPGRHTRYFVVTACVTTVSMH